MWLAVGAVLVGVLGATYFFGGFDGPPLPGGESRGTATADRPTSAGPAAPSASEQQTPGPTPAREIIPLDFGFGFEPVTSTGGSGETMVALPPGVAMAIVSASYVPDPERVGVNALVNTVNAAGDYVGGGLFLDLSRSGSLAGTGLFDRRYGADAAITGISVLLVGTWTVTITPIASAAPLTLPAAGDGPGVFRYDGPAADLTYTGSAYSRVFQHTDDRARTAGAGIESGVAAPAELLPGPSIVVVDSAGPWTLAPG